MTTSAKPVRADRARTREKLLDALGVLLERQGLDVSLPDLARESGVAVATVYRHFDDLSDLRAEFYRRVPELLSARFEAIAELEEPHSVFGRICTEWVATALPWARPATFIRSAEGYLERLDGGDPLVVRLHAVLARAIEDAIAAELIPPQSTQYAALMWVTIFDERVLVDLESTMGWSGEEIAKHLERTVLAALSARDDLST